MNLQGRNSRTSRPRTRISPAWSSKILPPPFPGPQRPLPSKRPEAPCSRLKPSLLEGGNGFAFPGTPNPGRAIAKSGYRGLTPTRRLDPHNQIFDRVEGKHSRIVDENGKIILNTCSTAHKRLVFDVNTRKSTIPISQI